MDNTGRELPTAVDLPLVAWDRATFGTLIFYFQHLMTPSFWAAKRLTASSVGRKTMQTRQSLLSGLDEGWNQMHNSKKVPVPNYRILIYKYQNKPKKNVMSRKWKYKQRRKRKNMSKNFKKKSLWIENNSTGTKYQPKKILINYQMYHLLMINYEIIHFEQFSTLFRVFSRR